MFTPLNLLSSGRLKFIDNDNCQIYIIFSQMSHNKAHYFAMAVSNEL
jgi:hypothetical protein